MSGGIENGRERVEVGRRKGSLGLEGEGGELA